MGQGHSRYENISMEEKKLIRESWLLMRNKMSIVGSHVFRIFLEDYDQHKDLFALLSDEESMDRHSLKVMRDLSQIVNNIESSEHILYIVRLNALLHRKVNIGPAVYDDLRTSFHKMMMEQFSEKIEVEPYIRAWDKGLRIIFQIICDMNYEGPLTVARFAKINKTVKNQELRNVEER